MAVLNFFVGAIFSSHTSSLVATTRLDCLVTIVSAASVMFFLVLDIFLQPDIMEYSLINKVKLTSLPF